MEIDENILSLAYENKQRSGEVFDNGTGMTVT